MPKSPLLRYTALSALTLIPLTYSVLYLQDTNESATGVPPNHESRHRASSHHSCSHCADPLPADRQAAQAQKIAAAGLLWENSSPDPASAAPSMRISSGMPTAGAYQKGSIQKLTLEDGTELKFTVNNRHIHTDGTVAVNADLPGTPAGRLHMQWNESNGFFLGQIEYPHHPVAYEITHNDQGESTITRRSIDQLVCAEVDPISQEVSYGLQTLSAAQVEEAPPSNGDAETPEEAAPSLVPALNSYPSAEAVVYLDFDGESVKGTIWGSNITAAPSGYSDSKITWIWKRVSADMEPFNLNVTTEESVYLNAPPAKRIRCIITPSYEWYSTSAGGGIAYRHSFAWTGDTPCFVFQENLSNRTKSVAETCSHEVGHTLGLTHDGKPTNPYYYGHGTGDVGWAPIMGSGSLKNLTQWSKGEYTGATNTEDDLSVITSGANGFGYRNDDHNNQNSGATTMPANASDQVSHAGVIEQRGDVDVFTFNSGAGSISLDITSPEIYTNLDIEAKLYDDKGKLLVTANPATLLDASISTTVDGGTYYLHIQATGYGTASTGYTDYASLGSYVISGQVTPATAPPAPLTPYEQTVASLAENERSMESDPDGDGLNNLTEHAFGTNPAVATPSQRFTKIDPTGSTGADFIIDLPSDIPADALYTVEATCDLGGNDWTNIASRDTAGSWSGTATVTEESGPEGKRRFRVSDDSEESWSCRFMRVRFHLATNP